MVSIFRAIRENDLQLITCLIDEPKKKTDINKRSTKGRTPLHLAVTWNRLEIAQALIDCPLVNVNLRDRENGWTALHRYIYYSTFTGPDVIYRLIDLCIWEISRLLDCY